MPGQGGVWLVQEIKRRWPQTAIIVVTAGTENEALMQCLSAGVQHYFLKPVHIDEYHHALQTTWYSQLKRASTIASVSIWNRSFIGRAISSSRTFFSANHEPGAHANGSA